MYFGGPIFEVQGVLELKIELKKMQGEVGAFVVKSTAPEDHDNASCQSGYYLVARFFPPTWLREGDPGFKRN
jgi:hypothetical protein